MISRGPIAPIEAWLLAGHLLERIAAEARSAVRERRGGDRRASDREAMQRQTRIAQLLRAESGPAPEPS